MARKFKCRNGTILKECDCYSNRNHSGFINYYDVQYDPTGYWKKGELIVQCLPIFGFPIGGLHGEGYDIVEELKPKKKETSSTITVKVSVDTSHLRRQILLDTLKSLGYSYSVDFITDFPR